MEFDINKTWFGIGLKVGATFLNVGLEDTEGIIVHCATPARYSFSLLSGRLGAGLGASAGLVGIFVFNCDNPKVRLHNTNITDWSINISTGENFARLASFAKFCRAMRLAAKIRTISRAAKDLKTFNDASQFVECAKYAHDTFDLSHSDGQPKLLVVDTPVNIGLELSINYCSGKLEVH
jgi:hypothetical protein